MRRRQMWAVCVLCLLPALAAAQTADRWGVGSGGRTDHAV